MWGSDWPVCLLVDGYEAVKDGAIAAVGNIAQDDHAKLMGGNAARFYRLA